MRLTTLDKMIMASLRMAAGNNPNRPISMANIAEEIGRPKSSTGGSLRKLRELGMVKRIGQNKYICKDHLMWSEEDDHRMASYNIEKNIVTAFKEKKLSADTVAQ